MVDYQRIKPWLAGQDHGVWAWWWLGLCAESWCVYDSFSGAKVCIFCLTTKGLGKKNSTGIPNDDDGMPVL